MITTKASTDELIGYIDELISEYSELHFMTSVEENVDCERFLVIHYWKHDNNKFKDGVVAKRIKEMVSVYGECSLEYDHSGETTSTNYDVYKMIDEKD